MVKNILITTLIMSLFSCSIGPVDERTGDAYVPCRKADVLCKGNSVFFCTDVNDSCCGYVSMGIYYPCDNCTYPIDCRKAARELYTFCEGFTYID